MTSGTRILSAAIVTMVGLLALSLARTANAAPGQYYGLHPTGYTAYGSGTVALETVADGVVVHLDLVGARPGTLYRISACTGSTAGPCSSAPDPMMTDTTGSFHGSVKLVPPGAINVVTVVNVNDANDAYAAPITSNNVAAAAGAATSSGGTSAVFVVPPAGWVFVPGVGWVPPWWFTPVVNPLEPMFACPPGFHGPLTIIVGGAPVTITC